MHASNHLTAAHDFGPYAALREGRGARRRDPSRRAAAALRALRGRERPHADLRCLRGRPPRGRDSPVPFARCLPSITRSAAAACSRTAAVLGDGRRADLRVPGRPPDPADQIRRQHRARRLGGGDARRRGAREARRPQSRRSAAAIVALPLAASRQRERGFNQAGEIATRVAAAVGLPVVAPLDANRREARRRPRCRGPRAAATCAARSRCADPVRGARIALVDDVMTTGATLAEASRVLMDGGRRARRVLGRRANARPEPRVRPIADDCRRIPSRLAVVLVHPEIPPQHRQRDPAHRQHGDARSIWSSRSVSGWTIAS